METMLCGLCDDSGVESIVQLTKVKLHTVDDGWTTEEIKKKIEKSAKTFVKVKTRHMKTLSEDGTFYL